MDHQVSKRPSVHLRVAVLAAGIAVASLTFAGCGSSATSSSHSQANAAQVVKDPGIVSPVPAVAASLRAASHVTPAAGTSTTPAARTGTAPVPSPAPSAPQYAAGTTPAPATAQLAATCLTPGGTQTLRVHSRPTYGVTYDAQYSDKSDGQKYGGVGTGHIDGNGDYIVSWVLQPGTPNGNVVVWVSVAGGSESAFRQPTFVVASAC